MCVLNPQKKAEIENGHGLWQKELKKRSAGAFCQLLTFLPSRAVKLVAKMRVQTILPLEPKGEIRSKIPQMEYRIEP